MDHIKANKGKFVRVFGLDDAKIVVYLRAEELTNLRVGYVIHA